VERLRRHFARHGEWWWVPVVYALAVAWIYRDLWHQHGVATGLGWDTIDTHGPDLDFLARDLREGRWSLWNPYDKGGYPLVCDPVFDRAYPFNWPFALWGAVFGTSWWLVQLKVLAHHVAAAACLHLFLRSRGLSVRAALSGGIALVASAPLLTHKASNILWPLVWVPLVWLAIDAALARLSWRRGAAVAAAFTLCATAGSPPGLFYALLLVLPYALFRAAPVVRVGWRTQWKPLALCAGVAIALAGLVLALTVLPTRALTEFGSQERFAAGSRFALDNSLPLGPALRGVAVRGAGLFEMYIGAAAVLLAACGLALRPRFDRGAAIALAAIALVGVLLAAGESTPLLPWLVAHVPGFAILRVPGRYKLMTAWAIAACAGYGMAAVEHTRSDQRRRWHAIGCAGGAVVVAVVVVVLWGRPESPKDRAAWWSIVAMVVPAALAGAAVLAPRQMGIGMLEALIACVLIDAPAFTFVEPGAPPAAEIRRIHDDDEAVVARLIGARDHWRIYDEFVLGERAGARLRVRDFRGYPATGRVDPLNQARYLDILELARRDPAILSDFNVRWVLSRPHFRYSTQSSFVTMPGRGYVARGDGLWEASAPAPLCTWYGAARVVAGDALAAVRAVQEPDGSRRYAILEAADALAVPPAWLAAGRPAARECALERYDLDAIDVTIDAPSDGLVVLNEVPFPGWRVAVDGEDTPALRANYIQRGVWVSAGHHTIAWRFEPAHWHVLAGGYLLALAVMLGALVATLRARRQTPA
jgi:hypothetical protein